MTEADWLACTKPMDMLRHLGRNSSARKLRLFGCACCRRIWDLLPHENQRRAVIAVENHPNATFDEPTLRAALEASSRHEFHYSGDKGYWAVKYLGRSYYKVDSFTSAVVVATYAVLRAKAEGADALAEGSHQAWLLRELFGNPFRPVSVDSRWLHWKNGAVAQIARSIYDGRDFERLPVLGAAMAEAGCEAADLLSHCQEAGPHVRGCWVVDLLLNEQ
jgi:hypothetical protein